MTAAIYTRVSTEDQVAGTSLTTQESACRAWCAREGYDVAEIFSDAGETAKTSRRPAFLRCVAWCREHHPAVCVVWKYDRWARNSVDHHVYAAALEKGGTRVVSATEPASDDPAGRLLATILAGVAQFDNEVRAERVRTAMCAMALKGAWLHIAPVGYRAVKIDGVPGLEPDPIKAPIVRELFARVSTGSPVPRVIKDLADAGHPYSRGSIHRMLRMPVYAGIIRSDLTDGRDVPAVFDGLVSLDTWSRVQMILAGVDRRPQAAPSFPLRGMFLCGECDSPIWGSASRGRSKRYAYYHCREGHVRYRVETIHAQWSDWLRRCSKVMVGSVLRLRAEMRIVACEETERLAAERAARTAAVHGVEARRQRLLDGYLSGDIEPDLYREQATVIARQLDAARAALSESQESVLANEKAIDHAALKLEDLSAWWGALDTAEQREAFVFGLFGAPLAYSPDSGFSNRASDSVYGICAAESSGGLAWWAYRDAARIVAAALWRMAA
jgi:site-specific DNA recombinase